jgi:diguanylate cyclase (GGDEF)-like protein/PAS domain S-box-containing protein
MRNPEQAEQQANRAGRVELLYQHVPFALFAIFVIAPILVTLLWGQINQFLLIIWVAATFLVTLARFLSFRHYIKVSPPPDAADRWEHRFIVGVFLSGCLWGVAGILFYHGNGEEHHFAVLLALSGLCGGALTSLMASRKAYTAFVFPTLSPLAIGEMLHGTAEGYASTGLIVLFIVLTMIISRRSQAYVDQSIAIRHENDALLQELETRNQELQLKHESIKAAEQSLRSANALLEKAFSSTHVLFAHLDREFNFLQVNRAYAEAGGHPAEYYLGKNHFSLYPSDENEAIFRQVVSTGESYSVNAKPFINRDNERSGITYWDWSLHPIRNDEGYVEGVLLVLIDVTEYRRAESTLQEKETYLTSIMQTAVDGIVTTDEKGVIEMANDAVAREFGYPSGELVGKNIGCLMPDHISRKHAEFMHSYISTGANKLLSRKLESVGQRNDGTLFPLEITVSESVVNGRRIFTGVMRDITAQKQAMQSLEEARRAAEEANSKLQKRNAELLELSTHDSLTGIANRRSFTEHFHEEWGRAMRVHTMLAVVLIDIDHFKAYNDYYGHQQGDKCLQKVATILSNCLKRPTDLFARYGGEEFIAVLPDTDLKGACHVAEQMRAALEQAAITHHNSSTAPYVTICLGVAAVYPSKEQRAESLISAADKALYEAKRSGRNRAVCAGIEEAERTDRSAKEAS